MGICIYGFDHTAWEVGGSNTGRGSILGGFCIDQPIGNVALPNMPYIENFTDSNDILGKPPNFDVLQVFVEDISLLKMRLVIYAVQVG